MQPRHNVLVVGAGSIGERHVRCFQATGRADVSFVEVNAQQRMQVAERCGPARAFASLDEALRAGPDVAVIATPAPLHIAQATLLASQGLHLLIEKPLSVSLDGVDALVETVRRAGVVAAVAYVYRAHPALAAMKAAIDSGRFGPVLEIVAVSGQHFPLYRPAYRQTYYTRHEQGGGAVQDALTHLVNAGEWLAGPVTRLAADCAHLALEGVDVEDTVHVLTRQASVLGIYSLNQHQAPNETTLTVICQRATLRFEYHRARWMWMPEPGGSWREEDHGPLERDALFIAQANRFLDAVEGKAHPACSLEEAIQTLKVNRAILASAERQTWETIT